MTNATEETDVLDAPETETAEAPIVDPPLAETEELDSIHCQISARLFKAALLGVSKEDYRPNMCGVYVQLDSKQKLVTSTDGFRAMVFREEYDNGQIPVKDRRWIIPAEAITRALKLTKFGKYDTNPQWLLLPGVIRVFNMDGNDSGSNDIHYKPVDEKYPPVYKVFQGLRQYGPEAEEYVEGIRAVRSISVNPAFMEDMVKIGKILGLPMPRIKMSFTGKLKGIGVQFCDYPHLQALVIPVRDDGSELLPSWFPAEDVPQTMENGHA